MTQQQIYRINRNIRKKSMSKISITIRFYFFVQEPRRYGLVNLPQLRAHTWFLKFY